MFKEELQKASSQKTTVPVKEESVKVSETSEQLNQTIDNGSADLFAMLDDPAPIDSGKTESTQADSDTDSEITFSEEIKNSHDESVSVNDDILDSEDKEAVSLSTSESAAPEESLNCDNTFSDSTDDVPFDVKESALTKEETVIASSENSKIIKNSFKGDDLDVLISAFEHTVKNTVTSIAKPNASKYADELKRILKKEEIVSDVVPKAVSINAGRLSENTKITVTENSALIEDVFNYLDLIKAKSDELVLKISKNSSAPVNDAKSHIEGISAVVSDINSINKELSDDAPSKSVLSAISKLPSFDENGNIVAQNPVEETTEFKLEAKEEPLSADELLLKAQEAARAQLMLDQNLNEKLLAESKEINAKTNLAELLNSDDPVKNEVAYNKDGDVLIEDNIEELKNVASSCNDAVADATVNEITDSNDTADLISSNDDVLVEPFNQLTTLQDALNIELGRKVNVSSYSVVSEGKNNYSDALIQAVNASLSGKFGSNRNVVEGVIPESKSVESAEAKTVPLEEQIKEPFEIVPEVEPEYVKDIPVLSEAQKTIVDSKTQAHSSNVSGPLLNSALTGGNNTNFPVKDGNPRALKSATLKIIEEDQQFENRRLGRKLETSDFYPKVIESSQWLKTIRNAGYTDGPMYSTLCYANRKINPNDEYDWTLEVSSDFEFLTKAPEFLHNLQTKFSILMNHPVKLSVKIVEGVPFECPEDLARKWYLKELENSRIRIRENVVLNRLLTNLGEDVNTINLTLYTQEDN